MPATLPAPQVPTRKERTTLPGRTRWCRLVRNYDIPLYPKTEEIRCQQRALGQEDPLEKGMATHSSILAWRIPRTEELRGLQSMGLQKGWTQLSVHIHTHSTEQYWRRCSDPVGGKRLCFLPFITELFTTKTFKTREKNAKRRKGLLTYKKLRGKVEKSERTPKQRAF